MTNASEAEFPIVRAPGEQRRPVLVSVPHFGTERVPGVRDEDFSDPAYHRFPQGYADAGAAALYGSLHAAGATVVATPISRLFVDVNRARSHFDVVDGVVRSDRGVVRTHIMGDRPIFRRPLAPACLERRLTDYYDPYHAALDRISAELVAAHGGALVLDAHTGSEKRMGEHEIIIGTRRGQTAGDALRGLAAETFRRHGFRVQHDVPGYSGAHTVQRLGKPSAGALHAIQVEVNSGLLLATSRREYFARLDRGQAPALDPECLVRLQGCLEELVHSGAEAVTAAV